MRTVHKEGLNDLGASFCNGRMIKRKASRRAGPLWPLEEQNSCTDTGVVLAADRSLRK
jgi:hypothetical protein